MATANPTINGHPAFLPDSSNQDAARLERSAQAALSSRHVQGATSSLYRAIAADPKFTRALIQLGTLLMSQGQKEAGLEALHQAIAVDPRQSEVPKYVALGLMRAGLFEEAAGMWRDFIHAFPEDFTGPANLGLCLSQLGRYPEAIESLEAAVKINPDQPALQANLGSAYLRAGQRDKAEALFARLSAMDPDVNTLNNVAYELSGGDSQLPLALDFATRAAQGVQKESQKILLPTLAMQNVGQIFQLSAYWDTLGWVYERMSKMDVAEQYLTASWRLTQSGAAAGHLCDLYRQTHQDALGIEMCRLAIFRLPHTNRSSDLQTNTETAAAHENLDLLLHGRKAGHSGGAANLNETGDAATRFSDERTFKLPRFLPGTESAEFWVLLTSDGKTKNFKVADTKFISGSDKMKDQAKQLMAIDFKVPAPSDVPTHFVRRGILGCYQYTGCSFVLLDPSTVQSLN